MKQKRKGNAVTILKRSAKEYCESTTLHGFAYWVQASNSIERVVWISFTIGSLVCAGIIISSAVRDWEENPGVTSIASFNKVFINVFSTFIDGVLIQFTAINGNRFPVSDIL